MTETTVIIDYESGNLRSAEKSFQRMAAEGAGGTIMVTADPEAVRRADRIVLPGVGAYGDCRAGLDAIPGMVETLQDRVHAGTPFLGICVGQQLMCTVGREHGHDAPGFDWIPGECVEITPGDPSLKIPHMGWNVLDDLAPHPVLTGITPGDHAYFVHSFHVNPQDPGHILARADYGGPLTAIIGRDTMIGTQFHPEKSQTTGLRLIANFLDWRP
ncbi:MAG: imidazole glycerol phosphate synthase subunit HisH [Pseudomonadota bacterium]